LAKNTRLVKNFLRILVCPLDWGIGHATRCVPVIRQLREQNHEIIIAADGQGLEFLQRYFSDLKFIRFRGMRIKYPSGRRMIPKMIIQSPAILFNIFSEHQHLKKIIKDKKPDVVISDNRFGLWSKEVYSIYMTHQVMIKAPANLKWAEPLLHKAHRWFIRQYDECWIPDLPGDINLSGDLSHKYPIPANAKYIGLLSRFESNISHSPPPHVPQSPPLPVSPSPRLPVPSSPDLLFLLSGPEPQRTIFEKIILKELEQHRGLHAVILQGLPGNYKEHSPAPGVMVLNHLPDGELAELVSISRIIVCRPGYSTLMDLIALGRNAILVTTPGQTEQEYLAENLSSKGSFYSIEQDKFNLDEVLEAGKKLKQSPEFLFLTGNFQSTINISI
jgi:predicted glycosyltransferase